MKCSKLFAVLMVLVVSFASYADEAVKTDVAKTDVDVAKIDVDVAKTDVIKSNDTIMTGGNLSDVATLSLNFGFTTHNVTRGIVSEDQGLIFQPSATLTLKVAENVSVYLGTAMSFQDNETGADPGSSLASWAEADIFTGISVNVTDRLSAGIEYKGYTLPNNSGEDVHEINLILSYDDAGQWGNVELLSRGLQPYVILGFEFSGSQAQDGDEGIYMEVGVRPSWLVLDNNVELALPIAIGLSLDDYYGSGSNGYAYTSVGAEAIIPLKCLGTGFGEWHVALGVNFLFLGSEAQALNAGGDDFELIGRVGFGVDF